MKAILLQGLVVAALAGGIIFAAPFAARAQGFIEPIVTPVDGQGQAGCSDLINQTEHTVRGSVRTAQTPMADGTMARHEANFAIEPGKTWRICSQGPFFEGGKVEIKIKTMFPVFECMTTLGRPIVITAVRKADDSGYDWSATCY